jgi:sugar phosphate isomerase/epimerase
MTSVAIHGTSVAADLAAQLAFMASEGITLLELGLVNGTAPGDLGPDEIDAIAEACAAAGVRILALRTSIGLSLGPSDEDRKRLARCVRTARRLGAEHVLVQSYWRSVESGARDRFSVISGHFQRLLLGQILEGVVCCVRNVAGTTCETSLDLLRLIDAVGSSRVRAAFDPANAALVGEVAYSDGFPLLAPQLGYVYARDFDPGAGIFVPPGEGVCQWTKIMSHLRQSGLHVPLCLDFSMTHVGDDTQGGSPTRARAGTMALKGLLQHR